MSETVGAPWHVRVKNQANRCVAGARKPSKTAYRLSATNASTATAPNTLDHRDRKVGRSATARAAASSACMSPNRPSRATSRRTRPREGGPSVEAARAGAVRVNGGHRNDTRLIPGHVKRIHHPRR